MTVKTKNKHLPDGAVPVSEFMQRYRLSQKALAALTDKSQAAVCKWIESREVYALETPTGVELMRIKPIHTLPLPDKASY